MKKYWHSKEYRAYNLRRAAKSLAQRTRFTGGKRKFGQQEARGPAGSFKDYERVTAPVQFSLIENPDGVIAFINELRTYFDQKRKVLLILRHIRRIDYDAIVVLLSIMVRFKALGIRFYGDFPDDIECRNLLGQSGFLKNLHRSFENEDEYSIEAGERHFISTHGAKIVDPDLSSKLIEAASPSVWGVSRRCQGVQTTLVELMQNTFNHAEPDKEGDKHWWLSVNRSDTEKKVRFSFVDYGVGIFRNLENKPSGSKFYGGLERLWQRFHYGNNAELLRLILNGELHRTVTGDYFRGKGLPGMLESLNENWFSNLHIISNNVHASVGEGKYEVLDVDFPGTFVYWEVVETNLNFDIEQ